MSLERPRRNDLVAGSTLFALLLSAGSAVAGTPPSITNVSAVQRSDGSHIVDITYDLSDPDSATAWVGIAVSTNAGSFFDLTPTSIAVWGDVGLGIAPGTGKTISWQPDRDLPSDSGDPTSYSARVAVVANDVSSSTVKTVTVGGYSAFRNASGNPRFTDGLQSSAVAPYVDPFNFHDDGLGHVNQVYRPLGPNGKPIFQSTDYQLLKFKQPDAATRQWWGHVLRQMHDAGFDYAAFDTFGVAYDHDVPHGYDEDKIPFQPDFAGDAFARIFAETGTPLKVALFVDLPAAWSRYNWDRLRGYYGLGQWGGYQWNDNGTDPQQRIQQMPLTATNLRRYVYELMIRPFFAHFNRNSDRKRWQTHNDALVTAGGRPIVIIYAAGPQWFTYFENSGAAWQQLKNWFQTDFGVTPFLAFDKSWFANPSWNIGLAADAQQRYLGEWDFGNPPGSNLVNSWSYGGYRFARVSPGVYAIPNHWQSAINFVMGERWNYVDQFETFQGANDYFLDREWTLATSTLPNTLVIGHWDDTGEGEQIGMMDDFLDPNGGTLAPKDYYLKKVRNRVTTLKGSEWGQGVGFSPTFTVTRAALSSPQPDFAGSPRRGPAPLTVSFVDLSSQSPTSWSWNFGDGTPASTSRDPFHEYASAGTYTVSLTVNGLSTTTKTAFITVDPAVSLVAAFSSSPLSGAYGRTVKFTDQSTGAPSIWEWNFDSNLNSTIDSTEKNPAFYYDSATYPPGTYTVTLRVKNSVFTSGVTAPASISIGERQSWTASTDFNGTTQGVNQWYYRQWDGANYSDLLPQVDFWQALPSSALTQIYDGTQHPDVTDPARGWLAPKSGLVYITGRVKKADTGGGDGVIVRIVRNGTTIWGPQTISYADSVGYPVNVVTSVNANDVIYFRVNKNGNNNFDRTAWDPTIEYLP